jgi:hypothetical protein
MPAVLKYSRHQHGSELASAHAKIHRVSIQKEERNIGQTRVFFLAMCDRRAGVNLNKVRQQSPDCFAQQTTRKSCHPQCHFCQ